MNSGPPAKAAERPIFFDPSGRRRKLANWSVFLAFALLLVLSSAFGATLLTGSSPAALLPRGMRNTLHALASKVTDRPSSTKPWRLYSHHEGRLPVAAAFYVPWDPASRLSLQHHLADLDWVMPTTLSIAPDARLRRIVDRPFEASIAAAKDRPIVLPVIQNAAGDIWYGKRPLGRSRVPSGAGRWCPNWRLSSPRREAAASSSTWKTCPRPRSPPIVGFFKTLVPPSRRRGGWSGSPRRPARLKPICAPLPHRRTACC